MVKKLLWGLIFILIIGLVGAYPDQVCYPLSSGTVCINASISLVTTGLSELYLNASQGATAYSWGDWHPNASAQQIQINSLINAGYVNSTIVDGYFNDITNFTGTLINNKFCTYNGVSGEIDCNTDANNFNDSLLWANASDQNIQINALQGENTTIWNTLWETYTNITGFTSYNATLVSYATGAIKHYSNISALQGENTSIYNILYETYANITGLTISYNATLNSYATGAIKHYSNISALQGENTTVWSALQELNANDTALVNGYFNSMANITGSNINITGYTLTSSFINGVVGGLDMRGNPWYFSGTNIEIAENLTVDGVIIGDVVGYFNDLTNFTGTLINNKFCTYNGVSGEIDCNTDASNYNDSLLWANASDQNIQINALQGENTTIWNTLWETYTNITGFTSYNATLVSYATGAIKHYSNISALQGENTTLWSALQELNSNDTALNLSIEQRTSYNDSAIVNALQGENTTLWNMAYEFNQNITALNLSIEQLVIEQGVYVYNSTLNLYATGAIKHYSNISALQGENTSIYNILYELNSNDTALNLSIEQRTSYNDSAIVNALQGENTTVWSALQELNANDTALNLSIEQRTYTYNATLNSYATGAIKHYSNISALQGENTSIYNILYETYANITGITSYNDSAVVNALQGENTTIWTALWELNANDTALNLSIEQRAVYNSTLNLYAMGAIKHYTNITGALKHYTNITNLQTNLSRLWTENTTVWSALQELNSNDTALNLSIEQRSYTYNATLNSYATGAIKHYTNISEAMTNISNYMYNENATIWNILYETYANITGITSYNDSAVVNALQGENTTIWNAFWELNANDTALNLSIEQRAVYNNTLNLYAMGAIKHYSNISALQGENTTIWNTLWETYTNITSLTSYNTTLVSYATGAIKHYTNITNLQTNLSRLWTENTTIWSALQELNANDTALNLSIEQRTSYNDSAVVNALQGENTSIYNILYELNSNDTTLTNAVAGAQKHYTNITEAMTNISNYMYNENATIWNTKLQNGSNGNLSSLNIEGNLVVDGKMDGQPLTGMLGSGLIYSSQTNPLSEVNVTCVGLVCSYNAFTVKLSSAASDHVSTYCDIPAGSKTVTDNAHVVLYINNGCNIVETTITTYFNSIITTGEVWDFANMVCYAGNCEIKNGIGLEQRRMMKQRVLDYYKLHLNVVSGFDKVTDTFPTFNISLGEYVYLMDVVSTSAKATGTAGSIEVIQPNGAGWTMTSQSNLNRTTCNTGTGVALCTNVNRWRRIFIFEVGWANGVDTSELHQLLPSQTISYSSLANCVDTTTSPLIYTLPDFYTKAAVPLYALCIRPSDTAWTTSSWIDLRTVKTGTATSVSSTVYVPYLGASQDVDLGSYNIIATQANLIKGVITELNATNFTLNGAAIISYNDSAVVNALQGENTSIYNILYELNANDTTLTNAVAGAQKHYTNITEAMTNISNYMYNENATIWNILYETYANITGITSYNDSAVVNALQAENTTIWTALWELNANDTALNLSIEQRAIYNSTLNLYATGAIKHYTNITSALKHYTNITNLQTNLSRLWTENTTVWSALQELNSNDTTYWNAIQELNANDTALNLSVEQRAPLASPTFTGVVTAVRLISPELNATNFTLNGAAIVSYNDSAVVNALQGENTTVWSALQELNSNDTTLTNAVAGAQKHYTNITGALKHYTNITNLQTNLSRLWTENTTVWSALQELNTNDTAIETELNLSIEQRAPIASPTFTGVVTAVRLISPELNATNFTLNGAAIVGYNDSAVVNALQGENTTIWNMAYEFNQNITTLNLTTELRAPIASPTFTGVVTAVRLLSPELNSTNATVGGLGIASYNTTHYMIG
jgi:fructose-specific component phosphotransferase system IIB-like protein